MKLWKLTIEVTAPEGTDEFRDILHEWLKAGPYIYGRSTDIRFGQARLKACWERVKPVATAFQKQGWMRHPTSGRRRPGGDPAKEYIHP